MALPVIYESIPEELKFLDNWVLWRLEERDGKNTKIPYQKNGRRADTTNPDTWDKYDYLESTRTKSDGIGFVFSEDTGIIGIDWDKVRDPLTGEWDKEALEEILSLGSYAELSQSGTGAHVLIKGKIPGDRRRKGNIEMYSKERFFVVTGQRIEGSPEEIRDNQEAVNKLYEKRFGAGKKENKKSPAAAKEPDKKTRSPKMTDEEVLQHCRTATNSEKFIKLYDKGKWREFNYPSQSEADYALCFMLAFYTQDEKQLDRLFRKGALYREEWDRTSKYTLDSVLNKLTEVYSPEEKGKKKSREDKPEKVAVPFDVVADHILEKNFIFSMRDNKQIYLYQDGVYKCDGTEAILDTKIRNVHNDYYSEDWESINPDFPIGHIPKATTKYINEAIAYIRAYSHRPRLDIDKDAGKYVNLQNGLFDLEKWKFKEHTPDYLSICQTPVKYDPSAECPQIETFLSEVAKPDDIDFLYEWFGYCLTVDVRYQRALMVYGIPGTGKSVLLALLEMFIGTENCSAESLQKIEEDKYRAANVYGKRVNVCSDIPSTKLHKTEVFKKLVSGLDSIDAENKYQQSFKFRNVAKLAFSANKLPEGPKDPAFYERFCLIEFCQKFRGTDKDDRQLITKLTTETELSGLLNKALDGLERLYKNNKFSYSKTFEETEKEYILNSNPVSVFMEEHTVISDKDIDSTILYVAYIDWSKTQNRQFVSRIEFGRKLTGMGYTNYRTNVNKDGSKKATFWENVQLKQFKKIDKPDEKSDEKEVSGQDLGQDQENRSCPKISSQPITESNLETVFGQDPFSYVVLREEKNHFSCENIETVEDEKNVKNSIESGRSKTSCPSVCFFDSGEYGQDVLKDPVLDPVRQTKIIDLSENEVANYLNLSQMCKDLTTFKNTYIRNHGGIECIEVFTGAFIKSNPGYLNLFPRQAIIYEASKICKTLPDHCHTSRNEDTSAKSLS